jgi:putative molybdopterin biosynthesis protein
MSNESRVEFLTTQEVAGMLKVSIHTVRRWIKEGHLPAYKVGRGLRIKKANLDRWIEQHSTALDGRRSASLES